MFILVSIENNLVNFSLINDYCTKRGLDRSLVRFMVNGREIFETDTPASVGMKNGDKIDVQDR